MSKPKVKIDIVSDVVCPWCYIGKRRLEKAILQTANEVDVEIEFHPFELNPHMPKEGAHQKEYLSNKFGGEDRYEKITAHTTKAAAEEGLEFHFGRQKISPNTRDAHRIIQYAKSEKKQGLVKEALMKAYFTDGIDLTKKENLITLAVGAGLNKEKITELLNSEAGVMEIEIEEQQHARRGITSVPFFIVNNKYGLSGAQPTEVFEKVILDVAGEAVAIS